MAPRKAYLEFDAQPARITPYTPTEVSASTYSSPALTLAITRFGSSGITAQIANAGMSVIIGAIRNSTLFEALGITTSLISSLMTSANGWNRPGNKPKGPATRFGPLRSCIQPMTLRSHSVVNATHRISEIVTPTIQNVDLKTSGHTG